MRVKKNSKNHVFCDFSKNGDIFGFFSIFPITLRLILVFLRKTVFAQVS